MFMTTSGGGDLFCFFVHQDSKYFGNNKAKPLLFALQTMYHHHNRHCGPNNYCFIGFDIMFVLISQLELVGVYLSTVYRFCFVKFKIFQIKNIQPPLPEEQKYFEVHVQMLMLFFLNTSRRLKCSTTTIFLNIP